MVRLVVKRLLSVSQPTVMRLRAELGEIGATFLALWLIVVVAVLMGLMVFWLL
jgi:hypothetical protein